MSRSDEFARGRPQPGEEIPKLYHGTSRDFPHYPDMVMPASATGHANWDTFYKEKGEEWRRDRVFAAVSENSAWSWGTMGQKGMRPRVHEVELSDPINRDRELNLPSGGTATSLGSEYHGRFGRVTQTHWSPPPKARGWTQPALPPLNWTQHGARNWTDNELAGIEHDIAQERQEKPHVPSYAGQGRLFA